MFYTPCFYFNSIPLIKIDKIGILSMEIKLNDERIKNDRKIINNRSQEESKRIFSSEISPKSSIGNFFLDFKKINDKSNDSSKNIENIINNDNNNNYSEISMKDNENIINDASLIIDNNKDESIIKIKDKLLDKNNSLSEKFNTIVIIINEMNFFLTTFI